MIKNKMCLLHCQLSVLGRAPHAGYTVAVKQTGSVYNKWTNTKIVYKFTTSQLHTEIYHGVAHISRDPCTAVCSGAWRQMLGNKQGKVPLFQKGFPKESHCGRSTRVAPQIQGQTVCMSEGSVLRALTDTQHLKMIQPGKDCVCVHCAME